MPVLLQPLPQHEALVVMFGQLFQGGGFVAASLPSAVPTAFCWLGLLVGTAPWAQAAEFIVLNAPQSSQFLLGKGESWAGEPAYSNKELA